MPPPPNVTLPRSVMPAASAVDPTQDVLSWVTAYFTHPPAGNPAAAARAFAAIEWLAATLPFNGAFLGRAAMGVTQLGAARNQAREALGIAPEAPAQAVVDGLAAAAAALDRNDPPALPAALPPAVFTLGPTATVARLAEPPRVPAVRAALFAIGAAERERRIGPRLFWR